MGTRGPGPAAPKARALLDPWPQLVLGALGPGGSQCQLQGAAGPSAGRRTDRQAIQKKTPKAAKATQVLGAAEPWAALGHLVGAASQGARRTLGESRSFCPGTPSLLRVRRPPWPGCW